MNHLIVYCHPDPQSFTNTIKSTLVEVYDSQGHEVHVRDLYEIGFDPVLRGSDFEAYKSGKLPWDIKAEQDEIAWADFITFVYPIWWTGIPALLKGYFDRVFSAGFAYSVDNKGNLVRLLAGKRVAVFNTHGQPWDLYMRTGMYEAINKTTNEGIFEFCGMKVEAHEYYPSVPFLDDTARGGVLEQVRARAADLALAA